MVRKNIMRLFAGLGLLSLLLMPLAVLASRPAHQEVNAGNYVLEYGWLSEPALVGQPNALVINLSAAGQSSTPPTGTISVVSPASMAPVNGDKVEINVKVDGVDPQTANGLHWHLMVDDQIVAMVPISQTTVTVSGLANGMHTITASLASSDHGDIGQPSQTMIQVSGSTANNGPQAQDVQALPAAGADSAFSVDVSALKVEVAYGGQSKVLQLQPLADGAPGQYVAPFVPTKAGQYTVNLSGKLSGSAGASDLTVSVNPEEVEPTTAYAFPTLPVQDSGANSFGLNGWLALGGLIAGLLGLVLGILSFTRRR